MLLPLLLFQGNNGVFIFLFGGVFSLPFIAFFLFSFFSVSPCGWASRMCRCLLSFSFVVVVVPVPPRPLPRYPPSAPFSLSLLASSCVTKTPALSVLNRCVCMCDGSAVLPLFLLSLSPPLVEESIYSLLHLYSCPGVIGSM